MDDRKKIEVYCSNNVSKELLFYIADCWIEFVTGDLGLEPSDLLMVLPL